MSVVPIGKKCRERTFRTFSKWYENSPILLSLKLIDWASGISAQMLHDICLCCYLAWKRLRRVRACSTLIGNSRTVFANFFEKRLLQRHLPLSTMAAGKLGGNKPRLLPATSWNTIKKNKSPGKQWERLSRKTFITIDCLLHEGYWWPNHFD